MSLAKLREEIIKMLSKQASILYGIIMAKYHRGEVWKINYHLCDIILPYKPADIVLFAEELRCNKKIVQCSGRFDNEYVTIITFDFFTLVPINTVNITQEQLMKEYPNDSRKHCPANSIYHREIHRSKL